ncbi:Na+/H+ antiporter NhaA [Croceicoccus sp. F390]|uniref:Na(+)/H(+) antiporter NhaA n=1 Tax=Croceicoccus esteveae TaxID=3075597 RepID=A0ABU2ZH49_9SPHN|nr:Na+/H+ antiporter NhaA [Croceicoccus sp. F390]MDT0575915.1 Na+/H+ antiporter NhaA [Croceicoccus sp. F390]
MREPGNEKSAGTQILDFINKESIGGLALVCAAAFAMIWVNGGGEDAYRSFFAFPINVGIGDLAINKPLLLWINDGLMALFFFLVGLEVKREIVTGQLNSWHQAALPVYAAIGGMVVPALVFVAINADYPANLSGWAIPAATDIAFALGLLALLGSRVPVALKALLLAIAIIDDIGAILIIALFYTANLNLVALGLGLLPLIGLFVLNRMGVARILPYALLSLVLWVLVLKSGVHATLAGVAAAMFIPIAVGKQRPLEKLEHALHPFVAFVVLPVFAFANAGVAFTGGLDALAAPLSLGIAAGLVIGKQVGIFGACLVATKTRIASLPPDVTLKQIYGLSCLAGIGFTMSLFIGGLAFADPAQIDAVKTGVLSGSFISAVIGMLVLGFARPEKALPVATAPRHEIENVQTDA